jgi:hypothetical protein
MRDRMRLGAMATGHATILRQAQNDSVSKADFDIAADQQPLGGASGHLVHQASLAQEVDHSP